MNIKQIIALSTLVILIIAGIVMAVNRSESNQVPSTEPTVLGGVAD